MRKLLRTLYKQWINENSRTCKFLYLLALRLISIAYTDEAYDRFIDWQIGMEKWVEVNHG